MLTSAGYDQPHSDVLRLYQAFFEREPDVEGAVYWIGQYEAGANLDDLAWGFAKSTEFTNRYGGDLNNREFLEIVHGNVLGHAPDDSGMEYWIGQLDGGLSQHGVVRWVAANDEFATQYPFALKVIDISPAAFITAADLPSGWTAEVGVAIVGFDRTSCNNRVIARGTLCLPHSNPPMKPTFSSMAWRSSSLSPTPRTIWTRSGGTSHPVRTLSTQVAIASCPLRSRSGRSATRAPRSWQWSRQLAQPTATSATWRHGG